MRYTEVALLRHIIDLDAQRRLTLDLADDLVSAVPHHDNGLADAQPDHGLELMVDDGFVQHGQDRFGKLRLQAQHA